jgi:hypothetical protein
MEGRADEATLWAIGRNDFAIEAITQSRQSSAQDVGDKKERGF